MIINKRQFLRGAGGAMLALPFLPSVMSRAFAAERPVGPLGKCFFGMGTVHGGIASSNMYPGDHLLTQNAPYLGRTIRYGSLPTILSDTGGIQLSPTCTAAALTPDLVSHFNILRGLDIPYRIGHHDGGYLGNFGKTDTGSIGGRSAQAYEVPTIDQVLAWSPSFYTEDDLAQRMTQRSVCLGQAGLSWNFTSPSTRSGAVVPMRTYNANDLLFRFLFEPGSAYNNVDTYIIDRVKRSYDRLRRHPRLSRGDKARLDQHVARMFEVERKLRVIGAMGTIPAAPEQQTSGNGIMGHHTFPHSPSLQAQYAGLMNDVLVMAFSSGVTRVGTWKQTLKFADLVINDWHGQVAHGGFGAEASQAWALGWNQGTFEHVMVDLAAKMNDVTMADGTSLLHNSLIMFVQEAGQVTHHSGTVNYPVVTAGGAGGLLNTGLFIDYGDQSTVYDDLTVLQSPTSGIKLESPGLYYQQFLGTVLQSMGLPRNEYEQFTDLHSGEPTAGYGVHHVDPDRAADYAQAMTVMGDLLPVLTST